MNALICSRKQTTKICLADLASQVDRHAYPESVQYASSPERRFTVRESQSQDFGASLDAPEGSMLLKTLLPGA